MRVIYGQSTEWDDKSHHAYGPNVPPQFPLMLSFKRARGAWRCVAALALVGEVATWCLVLAAEPLFPRIPPSVGRTGVLGYRHPVGRVIDSFWME